MARPAGALATFEDDRACEQHRFAAPSVDERSEREEHCGIDFGADPLADDANRAFARLARQEVSR